MCGGMIVIPVYVTWSCPFEVARSSLIVMSTPRRRSSDWRQKRREKEKGRGMQKLGEDWVERWHEGVRCCDVQTCTAQQGSVSGLRGELKRPPKPK